MNRKQKLLIKLSTILFIAIFSTVLMARGETTITGIITDDAKIVTDDGMVYQILESEKAHEMEDLSGKKVTVTGVVDLIEGEITIDVIDFKLLK